MYFCFIALDIALDIAYVKETITRAQVCGSSILGFWFIPHFVIARYYSVKCLKPRFVVYFFRMIVVSTAGFPFRFACQMIAPRIDGVVKMLKTCVG